MTPLVHESVTTKQSTTLLKVIDSEFTEITFFTPDNKLCPSKKPKWRCNSNRQNKTKVCNLPNAQLVAIITLLKVK